MSSRLTSQQSSYLRSAAHQPVQWYPWGPEAFERARAERKPILLDIGAVWCHWCHVMDTESYEDPGVAELLNRDWVCIKVDRDERPDIDARYQRAVQALTGQGGWPLTGFLTPDGEAFYGGTYFPPDGKYGRPGFTSVLAELARMFRDEPDKVTTQAAEIRRHLERATAEASPGAVGEATLADAADRMARLFDFRHGGFGTQPKFPNPGACELLLARWFDTKEPWLREMVDRTMLGMARGGVYDQIGGGFHRYSVDARWIVPHFEKMSYDNSELLRAYVHAAASAAPSASAVEDEYRRVIEGTVEWVMEVLARPEGGYAASQDADVGADDDGDYFTWTPDEVRAVTTEQEFAVLSRRYDIDDAGEMHHNPAKNVLWIKQSVRELATATGLTDADVQRLLDSGGAKLKAARDGRKAPFVDSTLYTGWNAMMAAAMMEAGGYLGRTDVERHSLRSLERIFHETSDDDGRHGVRHAIGSPVSGILEDQVQAASAALDAFEVTGEGRWLERCTQLMEHVWTAFRADDGGLYDLARGRGGEGFLNQPLKPVQDAPTPSGTGVAALVFARLAEHTGLTWYRDRLQELLSSVGAGLAELSLHGATLLRAADWLLHPATHVVVIGAPDDPQALALAAVARRAYRPRKVVTRLPPNADAARLPEPLRAMACGATPRAYVCSGPQCAPPATLPGELVATLASFGA